MRNIDRILQMTPEELEELLDQVYLTGLHIGMYAERTGDDSVLDDNPFSIRWLAEDVEPALQTWGQPDAEDDMLCACGDAILRNSGLTPPKAP